MIELYETTFASEILRPNFLREFRGLLSLWIAVEDLDALSTALSEESPSPVGSLRRALTNSRIGAVVFSDFALKLSFDSFLNSLRTYVRELENQNFLVELSCSAGGDEVEIGWP